MDVSDFLTRTNNIILDADANQLNTDFSEVSNATIFSASDWLNKLELKAKNILVYFLHMSDFATKYDISSKASSSPMIYLHSNVASRHTYLLEAFPVVTKFETGGSTRQIEELVYHKLFETVIQRYTKSSQKPNQVLRDTRSAEFCYRLSIKVEAVPIANLGRPSRLILLREFLILRHLWESYRAEMLAGRCGTDQMIGFPMPFEFANVVGTEFDFSPRLREDDMLHFDMKGKPEMIVSATIPSVLPETTQTVMSSLSYMSYEMLGPSLSYLAEMLRTQGKVFSVSSAFKVFDQLICRLMIMHKYGVVHCDPNPACLFFGPGEACNVLYISEFGTSLVMPESGAQIPRFHDRFVSYLRFREKRCHYVHDLESAFYVLVFMLIGKLPWDIRMNSANMDRDSLMQDMSIPEPTFTDRTLTTDDKEKFWQTPDIFKRTFKRTDLEFNEPLYQNFSIDLLESLYSKIKEALLGFSHIDQNSYARNVLVSGSKEYNMYFGIRRVIASYFRFESLSPSLKCTLASSKIELLLKQCSTDNRIAWDLSHWCWNHLDSRSKTTDLKKPRFF